LAFSEKHYRLHYWRTHDGDEVDFVFEDKKGFVAIECKSNDEWLSSYNSGLRILSHKLASKNIRTYGVYLGELELEVNVIDIFPIRKFLDNLWSGKIAN